MEVADCALSDRIEKLETEIDSGNENFHFDPIFMKRMIKGTVTEKHIFLSSNDLFRRCIRLGISS